MSTIIDNFIAPPCQDEIDVLYCDDHLLLINKPSGLLSLSGKNPQNKDSVHHRLMQLYPGCTLVHRLDFGTSGLMLIARNKAMNALLCQQFSERAVNKVYSALLCGHLEQDEGVIDAPIARDPALFPLMSICAIHGKPAQSRRGAFLSHIRRWHRVARHARSADTTDGPNPSVAYSLSTVGPPYSGLRSLRWPSVAGHRINAKVDAACQRVRVRSPGQRRKDSCPACQPVLTPALAGVISVKSDNQWRLLLAPSPVV